LSTICSPFRMLNTDEAAHFSQHKHWDSHELLASFFQQVLPEICVNADVVFNVVTHHRTLRKKHFLKLRAPFPCLRVLNEWMIRVWRYLSIILNHEVQAQCIIHLVTQPEHYATRLHPLPNRPKHLCDELLGCSFSSQHVEAAHHHFNVTARELFGGAQSFL